MAKDNGGFNPFGGMFDLNGDGETDFFEYSLMTNHFERSEKRRKRSSSSSDSNSSSSAEIAKQTEELFKRLQNTQYAWRRHYTYNRELNINPYNYETENEYLSALSKAKYAWRERYDHDYELGVDPCNYETEDEYLDAINKAEHAWQDKYDYDYELEINPLDYDTEEEYLSALEEARYAWRDKYNYNYEFGIDPHAYETEREYLDALNTAKYTDQDDNVIHITLNVTLSECETEDEYAWRDKYGRDDEFKIDPLDYETEDEYLTALNKAKYAWRDKCDYDSEFGISPYDYETEAEYNQALHDAKYSWQKSWAADAKKLNIDPNEYDTEKELIAAIRAELERRFLERQQAAIKKRERLEKERRKKYVDPLANSDATIYTFCGVVFPESPAVYHYLTNDDSLNIDDEVIVPVGKDYREAVAKIVTIEKHRRATAPYPVDKAKYIKRKADDGEGR